MAKRKAVETTSADDLSPPPEDLQDGAAALANDNADLGSEQQPAKKRRTATRAGKKERASDDVPLTPRRAARSRKVKVEAEEDEATSLVEEAPSATKKKRQRNTVKVGEVKEEVNGASPKPALKGRGRKKQEIKNEVEKVEQNGETAVKRKRKTKEEKEAEAMPLAARTVGHKLFIGAHVSSAGGQCSPGHPYTIYTFSKIKVESSLNIISQAYRMLL